MIGKLIVIRLVEKRFARGFADTDARLFHRLRTVIFQSKKQTYHTVARGVDRLRVENFAVSYPSVEFGKFYFALVKLFLRFYVFIGKGNEIIFKPFRRFALYENESCAERYILCNVFLIRGDAEKAALERVLFLKLLHLFNRIETN